MRAEVKEHAEVSGGSVVSILFKDAEMNTENRVLCLSPFCGLFGLCM